MIIRQHLGWNITLGDMIM